MAIQKAIVLKCIDYKDSSKILQLYTENGHRSVIAHGIKKHNNKNRFLAQNLTLISVDLSDKELPVLKDSELLNEYQNIKLDPFKYTYSNHILELVNNVINEDSDHLKMFRFILKLFNKMNQGEDYITLSFIFELKLLYFIGYGLHFNGCNQCDLDEQLVFHISNGGLLCKHHLDDSIHTYGEEVYLPLMELYFIDIDKKEIPNLSDTTKIIIRHVIDVLYDEFVSYHTKSMKIIKQFDKY